MIDHPANMATAKAAAVRRAAISASKVTGRAAEEVVDGHKIVLHAREAHATADPATGAMPLNAGKRQSRPPCLS